MIPGCIETYVFYKLNYTIWNQLKLFFFRERKASYLGSNKMFSKNYHIYSDFIREEWMDICHDWKNRTIYMYTWNHQ